MYFVTSAEGVRVYMRSLVLADKAGHGEVYREDDGKVYKVGFREVSVHECEPHRYVRWETRRAWRTRQGNPKLNGTEGRRVR